MVTLSVLRALLHLRLRLFQPVRHVHLAVHRHCGSEVLSRLLTLACVSVELAEAEVAVGDEGAHAARLGESQRFSVLELGAVWIESVDMGCDIAEQLQRVGGGPGPRRSSRVDSWRSGGSPKTRPLARSRPPSSTPPRRVRGSQEALVTAATARSRHPGGSPSCPREGPVGGANHPV